MGRLLAGSATANITPPLGIYISGYYHARQASAVHDELWARALCLSDGPSTVALVSVDLIGMPAWMIQAAKERIAARTGGALQPEQVLIGCTHTHTAPETGSEPMFPVHAAYLQVAAEKIADAAVMACRALAPAEVAYGTGRLDGVSFNRRFWMKDGTLVTNPGTGKYTRFAESCIGNPDIVRPAGPIDPEVDVLSVRSSHGTPLAVQESTLCIYGRLRRAPGHDRRRPDLSRLPILPDRSPQPRLGSRPGGAVSSRRHGRPEPH